MKKWKKFIALFTVLVFAAVLPMAAFADSGKGQVRDKPAQSDRGSVNNEAVEAVEVEESDEAVDKAPKPWKEAKDALRQQKDQIEVLKDEAEAKIAELEAQLAEAEENEDAELIESLKAQIADLKVEKDAYRAQMRESIRQMQQIMKEKYTQEELDQLDEVSKSLSTLPGIKVLPVTNVFCKDKEVKFDTPPVIKEGRTLIPLRAISEATGAEVTWNSEEKTITITKDDKEIIVKIEDNKITVNGEELVLDVPAQIMNSRTVVPLRFIVENLDLQVNWDGETETIEIE